MANMAGDTVSRVIAKVLFVVLACWSAVLHAQESGQASAPQVSIPLVSAPVEGERLSDWLLRQPKDPRAYPTGLNWQVPSERYAQAGHQRDLLVLLAFFETAPAASRENLTRMVNALPVTGRVSVPLADPRWLQAHPKENPVLQRDHVLSLPQRPGTVSVLTSEGKRCTLPHRIGSEARDYLRACQPESIDRVDRAWVVQPDGSVRHFGIAAWNAQSQDEAAPGALIWAPPRDSGWSPQFSTSLVKFLATQGYDAILSAAELSSVEPASVVMLSDPARDAMITANDWGVIGLLQTPTARMAQAGEARFSYSRVYPYERSNVLLQPLDWLEAGFRYTNVKNRMYGSAALSGSQTYKDKGVDVKVRLIKESARLPQVALGFTDVIGTGLFSSEYLVASNRNGNFDWSLGMGWGYMGGSGNIPNPFSLLGKSFDARAEWGGPTGGNINTGSYFHGNSAIFGGVQYHTPSEKWLFKAEYDGNNYQHEPQTNNRKQRAPINLGLVYRYGPGIDLTAGLERGNTLMLGMTLHSPLDKLDAPKVSDAPMPPVAASRPTADPIWAATAGDIVAVTNWSVYEISREGRVLRVVIESASGTHWKDRIERLTAVLHRDAPAAIEEFELIFVTQGITMSERLILREPWVKKHLQYQVISDRFQAIAAAEPRGALPSKPLWKNNQPPFGYAIVPSWQQNLGGPDGFILFRAGVSAPMGLKLSRDTSVSATVNLGLLDNFANFKYDAPSNLPRVRTHLREYMTASPITLPNLQITHLGKLSRNQYYSIYGGLLESMYAGVGGEWLYRPWHSPFAFGIDINRVQQRGFKQDFSLRDYRATTGHATVYWDTGWKSTQVKLNVGQYLAEDIGATLDVSRTFNNGVAMGAWATKTDVSAEQFGEGSFDKGIYLKIPFDVMTTTRGSGVANLVWNPLTRDGGARLNRSVSLYGATNARSKHETSYAPALAAQYRKTQFGDAGDSFPETPSRKSVFTAASDDLAEIGRTATTPDFWRSMLLIGGISLASAVVDKPADKLAVRYGNNPTIKSLETVGNLLPVAAMGLSGMMFLAGEQDSKLVNTSYSSLAAGGMGLLGAMGLKYAVGRSRPDLGLGASRFTPVSKNNGNSSFPSGHTTIMWAAVTPYAKAYDAPWLYGVAALTNVARVGGRNHWLSDTVGGALLGYALGDYMWESQRKKNRGAEWMVSSNGVTAYWEME